MATTPQTAFEPTERTPSRLQELARRHLWMHFTRMGAYDEHHEIPILVRGEGCYVWDEQGDKLLDGLSSLFCVNAGHGRAELGEAAAKQAKELGFYTNWSYAHPPAIELAARIAGLAPGDLNRVFFTSGGSEAVESAWKLARAYHKANGEAQRTKIIARETAYHGTSLGALAITGITRAAHGRSSRSRRAPATCRTPTAITGPTTATRSGRRSRSRHRIEFEGPETVAAVILEPVQNSGGCFVPQEGYFQRVREICDEYGVLLISDEVICAWGRLGYYFGCERYGYQPDMITMAKALTSAYAPMGGGDRLGQGRRAVHARQGDRSPTASPSAATRCRRRWRWPTSTSSSARTCAGTCSRRRASSATCSRALRDIPIVGDVRGAGYFHAHRAGPRPGDQGDLRRPASRRSSCAGSCPASSTAAA